AATSDAMPWPSGSDAETANVSADDSTPRAVTGAVTAGARSRLRTVTAVVAESLMAFAALNTTLYAPASAKVGVQRGEPLVFPLAAVKLAPAGSPAAVSEAIASPSGSEALTFTASAPFSSTVADVGAVTTGARSSVPMTKRSMTVPGVHAMSFVGAAGPQMASPRIPFAPKRSRTATRGMARNADHGGGGQPPAHTQLPGSISRSAPPMPTVRCTTPCCG